MRGGRIERREGVKVYKSSEGMKDSAPDASCACVFFKTKDYCKHKTSDTSYELQ